MAIKIIKAENNKYIMELNCNGGICYDFACLTEEKLISLHAKIGEILIKNQPDQTRRYCPCCKVGLE